MLQGEDTISGFRDSETRKTYLNPSLRLNERFLALEVIPTWFKSDRPMGALKSCL